MDNPSNMTDREMMGLALAMLVVVCFTLFKIIQVIAA